MNPAVYGLLATLSVALGMWAVPRIRSSGVESIEDSVISDETDENSVSRKVFRWLSRRLGPAVRSARGTAVIDALNRRLDYAGRPGNMTADQFLGRQAASFVLALAAALLLVALGGSWVVLTFPLVAFLAWEVWLRRVGRMRQERIERDLPDFLDILSVTVRAGLGYRAALERVAESLGGPVGDEIMMVLRQMSLGVSRREAFEGLRERSSSDSMASFVTAQLQAEELGVPLADSLNDIAIDMRRRSHQNARRDAQRAIPRVSLITTMIIVPGAVILLTVSLVIGADIDLGGFG